LFGDAVVFAYRPGPPGQPEREQGLALVRVRDAALLARVIERINHDQKQGGELKGLEARVYKGEKYFRRVEARGDRFYWTGGPLLAYTGEEALLRRVIDRHLQGPGANAPPALAGRLKSLGADRALAVLWINPRALDSELRRSAAAARGPDAAVLNHFLLYWQAVEG